MRKLRKAAALAEAGQGPPLSDWERAFLEEVQDRIETYGSAFGDREKGNLEEPLSALQKVKLKEIDKKARGKGKGPGGLKRRAPIGDAGEDAPLPEAEAPARPKAQPRLAPVPEALARSSPPPGKQPPRPKGPPKLRVISGGKGK
ncbi:MAG: hypothetical protein AAGH87_00375 [Pseudomonadota bacterium]